MNKSQRPRISFASLRTLTLDQKTLLVVLAVFGGLCAFRAYHLFVTSFIVSDEYRYLRDALSGNLVDGNIAQRFFYTAVNALLFDILGIRSLDQFVVLVPIYLFAWGGSTILVFYKLMKLLEFNSKTIAAALLSSLALVSFTLLELGFVSEPASLMLASLGVYLFVWFAKRGNFSIGSASVLFLAALVFAASSFSRETYAVYLMGGTLALALTVLSKRSELKTHGRLKRVVGIAMILAFAAPSIFFLYYPFDFIGSHVIPIVRSIGSTYPIQQVLGAAQQSWNVLLQHFSPAHNASGSPPNVLTTTTETGGSTGGSTGGGSTGGSTGGGSTGGSTGGGSTGGSTGGGSTGGSTSSVSSVLGNAGSTQTSATQPASEGLINGKPLSVVMIQTTQLFLTGLALGWGPVLFPIAVIGTVLVFYRAFFRPKPAYVMVFWLTLFSFGSYFVVSYLAVAGIFGNTDSLAFQHYSTIIRFTNTASPAYFLVAPFIFSLMSRRNRYLYVSLIAVLVFALVAVQVYPSYASSNLGVGSDPFSLGYRSGGAMVRDYVITHRNNAPLYIIGFWPQTWQVTTGTSLVSNGTAYFFPSMNESEFVSHRWSTFYVYGYSIKYVNQSAPFLVPLVYPNSTVGHGSGLPITVISRQVVANQSNFLIRFQIRWNG